MNKDRRKRLSNIWSLLEEIREEEQEAFDNLADSLQYSLTGEGMEQNIDELTEVMDSLNLIIDA